EDPGGRGGGGICEHADDLTLGDGFLPGLHSGPVSAAGGDAADLHVSGADSAVSEYAEADVGRVAAADGASGAAAAAATSGAATGEGAAGGSVCWVSDLRFGI